MSNSQFPKAFQDDVLNLKKLGENLTALDQQSRAIDGFIAEKKKAIEELSNMEDDVVAYKLIGNVLIKSEKTSILEGLNEDVDDNEVRKKHVERQMTSLKKKYDELSKRVQDQYEKFRSSEQ
jgi:prefoldin beta subunit